MRIGNGLILPINFHHLRLEWIFCLIFIFPAYMYILIFTFWYSSSLISLRNHSIYNDQVTLRKELHSKWSSHITKGVTFKMTKSHYKKSLIWNDQVTFNKELHSKWSDQKNLFPEQKINLVWQELLLLILSYYFIKKELGKADQ